uniref:Uncharacterized protein n=1 Tax=Romanomermis culicivorax TaxID=13658 RepID=A0A915IYK3_ROMCU
MLDRNSIKSVPVSLTSDYYTSQQSLSASCRSSHCGSPSLDQESVPYPLCSNVEESRKIFRRHASERANQNKSKKSSFMTITGWDSFGCESNVSGFRANTVNNANDASDVVLEVELPNHHYHTRQQFKRFLKHQQKQETGGVTPPAFDGGDTNNDSSNVAPTVAAPLPIQTRTTVELSPTASGQDSKNVFGLNYESVVADHQTPTDDTLYNKQLASPANSCGSSIDELESINGSSTAASETGGIRDKNFADSDFAVPELKKIYLVTARSVGSRGWRRWPPEVFQAIKLTSHIGNWHRSSFPNPQNSKFAIPGAVNFLQNRGNNTKFSTSDANNISTAVATTAPIITTTTAEKRKWSQVQQSGDLNRQQQNFFVANFVSGGDSATATKTNHNYFSGGGGATAFRTSASSFRQPAIVATRNAKNQVIGNTGASCEGIKSGGDSRTSTPTLNDVWKCQDLSCGGDSSSATANALIRRQPVRLVIPPALTMTGNEVLPSPDDFPFQTPSSKVSPRKKYRSTTTTVTETSTSLTTQENDMASENGSERQRPSLNFEKMREKLKNKGSRRKHQTVNTIVMKSKLRGWNGGYQLRSTHSECLFQPLRFPPSPPNSGAGVSGE